MPIKINIGTKDGKTFKLEQESNPIVGKSLGNKINGKDISPDFDGYEFEVKGASDKSGFMSNAEVEGQGLKKVLLTYGKGMKKRPRREGKKKQSTPKPKGLRLRKTVRGKILSDDTRQINLKLIKEGSKKLTEIFPDQNKAPEPEAPIETKEETKAEEKKE